MQTGESSVHVGFVAALGSLSDTNPIWASTQAGFLVLRLVDKWDAASTGGLPPTPRELQAVRRAVFAVDTVPVRRFLSHIVEAVSASWGQRTPSVLATVLAYAHELHSTEQWALAADAFEVIVSYARTADETELVPNAYLKLGSCLQVVGRVDAAQAAFDTAQVMGEVSGDHRVRLQARLGLAILCRHRGNVPAADVGFNAIIAEAESLLAQDPASPLADVLTAAMHDRATLAHMRGDHERAAALYHEALGRAQTENQRERLLSDASANLLEMGLFEAARDALVVVYLTATTRWSRLVAASNLMYLAQLRGLELEFEHYRRELAGADLPARVAGHFYLTSGQGMARFGRTDAARAALRQAIDMARRFSLNETLLTAESALDEIERGVHAASQPATGSSVPDSLTHVVEEVRRLRELAGAGT